jgi:hypothetical protein
MPEALHTLVLVELNGISNRFMTEIFMDYVKAFSGTKLHEEIIMRNMQCSLKSNKLTSKTPVTRVFIRLIGTFL